MSYLDFNRIIFPVRGGAKAWEPHKPRIQAILRSIQPMALGNTREKDAAGARCVVFHTWTQSPFGF
jgi:hypothetical protein